MKTLNVILLGAIVAGLGYGIWLYQSIKNQPLPPTVNTEGYSQFTQRVIGWSEQAMDPREVLMWQRQAMIYQSQGLFDAACATLEHAREMAPSDSEVAYDLGAALMAAGKIEESSELFREALKLKYPHPERCWYFLGRNALREEDLKFAQEAFSKASSIPASRYELAKLAVYQERFEQAEKILNELNKEFATATEPKLLLAQIHERRGDHELAALLRQDADRGFVPLSSPRWALNGTVNEVFELGNIQILQKQTEELLKAEDPQGAAQLLESDGGEEFQPTLWEARADVAATLEKPEEQLSLLQELIERDGLTSQRALKLGLALIAQEKFDEAREIMLAGVQLETIESPEAMSNLYQHLANLSAQSNNEDAARNYWAMSQYYQGRLQFFGSDPSKALEPLLMATEAAPELWKPFYSLGLLFTDKGDLVNAERAFTECLKLNPDFERAQAALDVVTILKQRTSANQ